MLSPDDLDAYLRAQAEPSPRYRGQLEPAFQTALAEHHRHVTERDCNFYHTIDLGDGRVITGEWDLRDHEGTYLGGVDLAGKRVMEYGPASGHLSSWMARRGADLTVFDLPIGSGAAIVDIAGTQPGASPMVSAAHMATLRNSWWYVRAALGYRARAVYADIFDPPDDLGRYDISVFSAILIHLKHPYRALEHAARITSEAIVVTDVIVAPFMHKIRLDRAGFALFAPSPPPSGLVHWWHHTPACVGQMLASLGFTDLTVTTHAPVRMRPAPPMFTMIGRRKART